MSKQSENLIVRPARCSDIPRIHEMLMQEIQQSAFYNETMKETEQHRITISYLKHLQAIEPMLILVGEVADDIAGFIIACPNQGALLLDWALALDEYKAYQVSSNVLRDFIEYFEHGQWHKISAYVRTSNRRPALLMSAFNFKKTCVLTAHIYGEDYALWERPLIKSVDGYELGIRDGMWGRLKHILRLKAP